MIDFVVNAISLFGLLLRWCFCGLLLWLFLWSMQYLFLVFCCGQSTGITGLHGENPLRFSMDFCCVSGFSPWTLDVSVGFLHGLLMCQCDMDFCCWRVDV